ncbi:hypothetical protein [Synechococcus sp. 8F6]|uniref:hypothetical protein n=1 Tax=Synechococcus sp. 8F6 TaxID=2025606 RepID=UPI00117F7CA7|nr:hypothetical protein [Synechococcus sp. 8F6]
MAVSILNQLNTTQLAEDFNDFLTGLGLGDMEPSTADRHRQDVEVSPMDDILALNGFDLNELFKKRDDSITGISTPLGHTSILLSATDPFNNDPITGTSESETLLASRAGGSMLIGGGGRDFYVIPLSTSPFAQSTSISDFDRASGSKIVLDTTDYTKKLGSRFKTAKSDRAVKKLARSKATFIFNAKTNELLLNGNGRARGLRPTNGGVIAIFENKTTILANDLLTFDGNSLRQLNGSEFFA